MSHEQFSISQELATAERMLAQGAGLDDIASAFATNVTSYRSEQLKHVSIIPFSYQQQNGEWVSNGQRYLDVIDPPQRETHDHPPLPRELIDSLRWAHDQMCADTSVRQSFVVSPGTDRHYVYLFWRDTALSDRIQALAIEFKGSQPELNQFFTSLATVGGDATFHPHGGAALLREGDPVSPDQIFRTAWDTFDSAERRAEMSEYLTRLHHDAVQHNTMKAILNQETQILKSYIHKHLISQGGTRLALREIMSALPTLIEGLRSGSIDLKHLSYSTFQGLISGNTSQPPSIFSPPAPVRVAQGLTAIVSPHRTELFDAQITRAIDLHAHFSATQPTLVSSTPAQSRAPSESPIEGPAPLVHRPRNFTSELQSEAIAPQAHHHPTVTPDPTRVPVPPLLFARHHGALNSLSPTFLHHEGVRLRPRETLQAPISTHATQSEISFRAEKVQVTKPITLPPLSGAQLSQAPLSKTTVQEQHEIARPLELTTTQILFEGSRGEEVISVSPVPSLAREGESLQVQTESTTRTLTLSPETIGELRHTLQPVTHLENASSLAHPQQSVTHSLETAPLSAPPLTVHAQNDMRRSSRVARSARIARAMAKARSLHAKRLRALILLRAHASELGYSLELQRVLMMTIRNRLRANGEDAILLALFTTLDLLEIPKSKRAELLMQVGIPDVTNDQLRMSVSSLVHELRTQRATVQRLTHRPPNEEAASMNFDRSPLSSSM